MFDRLMKGFIVVSLGFVLGCGGWMQKTKSFIQSPFGKKEETSEKITENSKENHMEKGKDLFMKGKMKSALKEFKAAATTDADSPEVHYNLGLTYYELGKYSEAINEYKEAIQLKPDFANAHFNLGVAYDQSGQVKDALQAYKVAMEYGIDDAVIHFNMGLSLLKLSRLKESRKEMLRALELEPNLAEAYNNLGYLDEAEGKLDLAVTNYKKALAIRPEYKLARENMARLVKVPAAPERPAIPRKKFLRKLFFEVDGKYAFTRDLEQENSIKAEIESNYQRALFRVGYNPIETIDLFLNIGVTSMGFDDMPGANVEFKRVLGLAYGAGLNADIYRWDRMNFGFDGGIEFLTGSNKEELKFGVYAIPDKKATTDWKEYTLFIKTRYLGLNNLVPYVGFTFSKFDGTFELDPDNIKIDFSEADPFGIFLGGSYYLGKNLRLKAEANFLYETSITFRVGYSF